MVEPVSNVAMNGRIVLNIAPGDRGINSFRYLPLESGDGLYVPSQPSTVNIIGTVYERVFLNEQDYRTGDYLKKAGEPSRSAGPGHMFMIGPPVGKLPQVGYEAAWLDEAKAAPLIQVIDKAVIPERKSWPPRLVIALFSISNGVVTCTLVLARGKTARPIYP